MTNPQFFFLASAIYAAPHTNSRTALTLVLLGTVLGLFFAVKDRK